MCPYCSILAPFCLLLNRTGNVRSRMLYRTTTFDGRRFITPDEALLLVAEGPCQCQLYEVLECMGSRYAWLGVASSWKDCRQSH